jgi:hypothetical protein
VRISACPEETREILSSRRPIESMRLDPRTQGDARTKKHADVCNIYLPEDLLLEEPRNRVCPKQCECWCHFTFTNADGSERDDADGLRAEIRRLKLEVAVTLEMRKKGQLN